MKKLLAILISFFLFIPTSWAERFTCPNTIKCAPTPNGQGKCDLSDWNINYIDPLRREATFTFKQATVYFIERAALCIYKEPNNSSLLILKDIQGNFDREQMLLQGFAKKGETQASCSNSGESCVFITK